MFYFIHVIQKQSISFFHFFIFPRVCLCRNKAFHFFIFPFCRVVSCTETKHFIFSFFHFAFFSVFALHVFLHKAREKYID